MNANPGDVIVCFDDSQQPKECGGDPDGVLAFLVSGRAYTVTDVLSKPGWRGYHLAGQPDPSPYWAYAEQRFRKIEPGDEQLAERIIRLCRPIKQDEPA